MGSLYCSKEDTRALLPPNVSTEGQNPNPSYRNPAPETVYNINIDFFIELASSEINSALATTYDIPLKRINVDGELLYPQPIPTIAAIFSAARIYERVLQGSDAQMSEFMKNRVAWAYDQMARIQNGELRIYGNRNTRGDRFVRSTIRPIPKNTSEGGRSKPNN